MFDGLYRFIDPALIWPFRIPGDPYVVLGLGLVWICLVATVIGEVTMAGAYFLNRSHFQKMRRDMVEHQNLSMRALGFKDKASYKACNQIANDEFGKNFFAGIALFASSVWPAFFAMGWLDSRFGDVVFDMPWGSQAGVAFFFVPTYILTRIGFGYAKPWLPLFSWIKRKTAQNEGVEELITPFDLVKEEDGSERIEKG